ncbi:MAG: HlyC/CorC family transporter [Bacteroidales bacterium]|nr:HlyC/CorC family transporter [Bacteroidales bacterium]
MSPDQQTWLIVSLISLLFSAIFSGVEIAFVTSDRVRLEIDVQKGGLASRILNRFYANSDFFISTILVGNNIMLVIYGMGAAKLLEPAIDQYITHNDFLILIIQTILSTGIILITGEYMPKTLFRINPNRSLRYFAIPIYLIYLVLYPISLLATAISKGLMKLMGMSDSQPRPALLSIADLNQYLERTIDDNTENNNVIENEVKIFHNALDFSTTHLRDCMTPRNEIVAVNIDTTDREDLSKLFTRSGRSKILVFKEDIDDVLGYIHVSELFDPGAEWKEHLKPVLFAPESLLADKMMKRMLAEKRSLAIVVDEFGGTSGMVTLEDLVEEIFGDIQDEHDKSGFTAREVSPGVYEFSGRSEIETINDNYHLGIPESDDYQTLAGYILNTTGAIPSEGEVIELAPLTFEILKKKGVRLELIRVTQKHEEE